MRHDESMHVVGLVLTVCWLAFWIFWLAAATGAKASRGRPGLSWAGSTQLGPDLPAAVREIRDRHEHVKVVGSLNLVQTLLRERLFDRLDL